MSQSLKIVLADDHGIVRSGLRALLKSEKGIDVVGEAADGRTAIELIETLSPDVVVLDVLMPNLNGVEATRRALAARPQTKVIGISANADEGTAVDMLRAGAVGFVAKDAAYEELLLAIRAAHEGKTYISSKVMSRFVQNSDGTNPAGHRKALEGLSAREREILQLIAEGRTTKEMARELAVSSKTIETHRRNVMLKLGVDSIAELTKLAIRSGLTSA